MHITTWLAAFCVGAIGWLLFQMLGLKLIDWLFKKYPKKMADFWDKINPNQAKALKSLEKSAYNNGMIQGFNHAFFNMNLYVTKAFELHSQDNSSAYSCFKYIMLHSDKLLKEFYPEVDFGTAMSAETFKNIEEQVMFHKNGGSSGSNLPN